LTGPRIFRGWCVNILGVQNTFEDQISRTFGATGPNVAACVSGTVRLLRISVEIDRDSVTAGNVWVRAQAAG
jgi:hypothetical protein